MIDHDSEPDLGLAEAEEFLEEREWVVRDDERDLYHVLGEGRVSAVLSLGLLGGFGDGARGLAPEEPGEEQRRERGERERLRRERGRVQEKDPGPEAEIPKVVGVLRERLRVSV